MIKLISRILIFIIVFQTFNDNLFTEYFGPNSLKISILIFTLFSVKYFFSFNPSIPINKNILLLSVIMIICSIANYSNLFSPLDSFLKPFAVIILFVVFSQYKDIKWLIFVILFSLFYSSLYCLLREDFVTEWTFRKTGGTGDPNEFSTGVLFGLGLLWGIYFKYKKFLVLVLLLSLFSASVLLAAGSKSAFLALIFLIFSLIFLRTQTVSFFNNIRLSVVSLLALSILSFTVYSLNKDLFFLFIDRFDSSYTAELRLDNWIKGFELFKDNWLFGLGVDNYSPTMENTFIEIDEGSTAAHNMFLKALYELGIFGFIPFILIFKKILYMMFSKQRHYIILLICSPLLIMGLSLSLTFEKYLWLVIAISFNSHFIKFFRNISLKYENSTFYTES